MQSLFTKLMQQVYIGMCAELKDNSLKVEPTAVCMSYVTGTVRHNYIGMDFKLHNKSCLYIWHSKDALTCMSSLKQTYQPSRLLLNLILSNKLNCYAVEYMGSIIREYTFIQTTSYSIS